MDKEYIANIALGLKTDTWDITGKVVEKNSLRKISKNNLTEILKSMKGNYIQKIPMFSAKKINGKHLYDYARKGIGLQAAENKVNIYDLKLKGFSFNEFCIKISCSSGTYIRSIANDLGERLGCGAVLSNLKRTRIGKFCLNDAINLDFLIKKYSSVKYCKELNSVFKSSCFVSINDIADKAKTIYVYGRYLKMLEDGYPLYGYMINANKTKQKVINENDVFPIKSADCKKLFLHKSIVRFDTSDIQDDKQKLTKSVFFKNFL